MPVLANIGSLATCRAPGPQSEIHPIADAALVWEGETIEWVGPERNLPPRYRNLEFEDAGGCLVIPGLIDCHTHLAFGGWRAGEFEQRCQGRSYQEIARAGGGIASTVAATRAATAGELLERSLAFLDEMARLGVTTVEAKSGYGLDPENELKLLEVYADLGARHPVHLVPTFLGAHVVPPEYRDDRAAYVRLLIEQMIPEVARRRLARFCDVFLEEGAFTRAEARDILEAGAAHGLAPKLHADQLSDQGGAALAAELGAASADHLEQISEEGIRGLAQRGVVAVSLPLAAWYLRQPPMPARRLLEAGVALAVATDFNPGSAPTFHLPLALSMACVLQQISPAEALKGATVVAARAAGVEEERGSLEAGKRADFVLLDATDVNQWLYHFRPNACRRTVIAGRTFLPRHAVAGR